MKYLMICCAFAFATSCNPKTNTTTQIETTDTTSAESISSKAPFIFTEANYKKSAIENEGVVLVDFWAVWCGPCRMVDPIIKDLAKEYNGQALIGKVNVDEHKSIAQRYNIRSIPTILIIKNGEVVDKVVGAQSKQTIESKLKKALK